MKTRNGIFHIDRNYHATKWSMLGSLLIAIFTISLVIIKVETINDVDGIQTYTENIDTNLSTLSYTTI